MDNGIGKAVKHYREKAGLSQREFADLLGYKNHSSIARIENGTRDVYLSSVSDIARALGVTPADLFFFSDKRGIMDFIPYLENANEQTLENIRNMLKMPEKKTESPSGSIKAIS